MALAQGEVSTVVSLDSQAVMPARAASVGVALEARVGAARVTVAPRRAGRCGEVGVRGGVDGGVEGSKGVVLGGGDVARRAAGGGVTEVVAVGAARVLAIADEADDDDAAGR